MGLLLLGLGGSLTLDSGARYKLNRPIFANLFTTSGKSGILCAAAFCRLAIVR